MILLDLPLAWPLLGLALVGIGGAARRACGDRTKSLDEIPRDGWVGWGIVLGWLQIWHLVFAVSDLALGLVLLAGLGLMVWLRPRPGWLWGMILLVPAIWLASSWTLRSLAIDTGLYHLGVIRWTKESAIVPGLALLHDRFGFNNSSFLWAALCQHWPWGLHRAAAGIEILFFFSVANALLGIRRVVTAPAPKPRDHFDALSLVPLLVVIMEDHRYDGPLSPDLLLFPLGLMVFSSVLGYLEDSLDHRTLAVLLLSACAVTVKLSFAGAALAVWGGVLWLSGGRRRVLGIAALVATGVGGVWSLRSILLTGWPVYPVPVWGVPVGWQLPSEEVAATAKLIRDWAWAPGGATLRPAEWLGSIGIQAFAIMTPLILGAVALGVAGYRRSPSRSWWALVPAVTGIGFWLASAPLPRFAGSIPWALALVALACALQGLPGRPARWISLVALGLLAARLVDPWAYVTQVQNGPPEIPYAELDIGFTDSGLAILVPVEGDQCWDAPLPHAPRLDPRLGLRMPGELGSGFRRIDPGEASPSP